LNTQEKGGIFPGLIMAAVISLALIICALIMATPLKIRQQQKHHNRYRRRQKADGIGFGGMEWKFFNPIFTAARSI
jgi:hypothetical protein